MKREKGGYSPYKTKATKEGNHAFLPLKRSTMGGLRLGQNRPNARVKVAFQGRSKVAFQEERENHNDGMGFDLKCIKCNIGR